MKIGLTLKEIYCNIKNVKNIQHKGGVQVTILYFSIGIFLVCCVWFDFRSYRIPNCLILINLLIGILGQTYSYGIEGTIISIKGMIIPILILYPLFILKALGAGDIKMFSVIGASLGWTISVQCIVFSFFLGAMISIILLFSRKIFYLRMSYFFSYVFCSLSTHKWIPYYNKERDGHKCTMHFSLAILFGLAVVVVKKIYKISIW